jgi:hypothetical protein
MSEVTTEAVERLAIAADEVFADLPYLLGRAATDGHAIAKRLAAITRPKLEHTGATLLALVTERDAALRYMRRLLNTTAPAATPLPDLLGVCTQVDNVLAGVIAERDALLKERNQWMANSRENKLIAESNLRERDAMRAAADNAARVLYKAGEQFAFYAGEHAKKNTPDADAKASTNRAWAERCFAAHAATADVLGDGTPDLPGLLSEAGTSVQD